MSNPNLTIIPGSPQLFQSYKWILYFKGTLARTLAQHWEFFINN